MDRYDLVVVGGGMVGLTLLASLQSSVDQGLRVAVVDPAQAPGLSLSSSPSFDDRATALSAQALQTLQALQLDALEDAISSIKAIEVSDRGHAGYHYLEASKQNIDRFGAVIANRSLGSLLWQRVQALPVSWLFNKQVRSLSPTKDGHTLTLSNGQNISAGLVLLCDGGRSNLEQALALPTAQYSFDAYARIATVSTSEPHQGRAFERFTEFGPIALLPFGDYSALVWTLPEQPATEIPNTKTDALHWLNREFGQRLGNITDISDWHEYPLTERQLPVSVSHGFLALGNAAATLHPVAGQGFNLAIRGIVKTAALVNRQYQQQRQLPEFNALNQLASDIQADQQFTAGFSRELIRLFGSTNPALQLARGIGLSALDRHPLFSKSFALAGMGLLQKMPSLADHSL